MGSLPANGSSSAWHARARSGSPGLLPIIPLKAKQLLAEAGYPNGAGFPVVQLWTVSKAESTKAELAAYQQYLAELGVKVDIHFVDEWTRYTEMLERGELQMFRYAWYADFPDPDSFFFPLLHSAGQPNYMFYRNLQSGSTTGAGHGRREIMRSGSHSTAKQSASSWKMHHGLPSITTSSSTCISLMCRE